MYSFLEQLYDAPIGYNGRPYGLDSDFVNVARIKSKNLDELLLLLTDDQKEIFENYMDAESAITDILMHDKFSYGFHLGALFMLEIMHGKERMIA